LTLFVTYLLRRRHLQLGPSVPPGRCVIHEHTIRKVSIYNLKWAHQLLRIVLYATTGWPLPNMKAGSFGALGFFLGILISQAPTGDAKYL
jgi:hypothetical protein